MCSRIRRSRQLNHRQTLDTPTAPDAGSSAPSYVPFLGWWTPGTKARSSRGAQVQAAAELKADHQAYYREQENSPMFGSGRGLLSGLPVLLGLAALCASLAYGAVSRYPTVVGAIIGAIFSAFALYLVFGVVRGAIRLARLAVLRSPQSSPESVWNGRLLRHPHLRGSFTCR